MKTKTLASLKGPITKPEDFTAPCGCKTRFDNDGFVRLEQCPLHHAAPDLLAALRAVEHDMGKVISAKAFNEFSEGTKIKIQAAMLKAVPSRSQIPKGKDWTTMIGSDVHVYKQDGGHWFDGLLTGVLENGVLVIGEHGGAEFEVNPSKNKVEAA